MDRSVDGAGEAALGPMDPLHRARQALQAREDLEQLPPGRAPQRRSAGPDVRQDQALRLTTLRRHWPIALVLALGALLRIACEIAYRPALFYSDSWGYLSMAHGGGIVSFAPLRPSGYPLILKVLHWLTLTTVVQHLAGLVVATLVYVTCRALNVRPWLAVVAGAFVALDAWAIALEQYILAEAFFSLALMLAVWASLVARRSSVPIALGFAGLCLAAATLMRPVGLFAVPAWIV